MPLPLSNSQPPHSAADLLERLLRSRLFAESIFGQILEQSSLYLEYPAGEFAAALVQRKVITPWQARELLAGRTSFYAGTFRLLECLETGPRWTLFAAEQSGPQRLVLLHVSEATSASTQPSTGQISQEIMPAPHLVRCMEVQHTAGLRLAAYEFTEAQPLTTLLAQQKLEQRHAADLLRQFARAIEGVSERALDTIGIEAALLDSQGEIKLLAEPSLPTGTDNLSLDSKRVDREMTAVHRFAAALWCLPEIAGCRSPGEVQHHLSEFAKPWLEAYPQESVRCPRAHMNRLLRKGPALRVVEELARGQQVDFTHMGASTSEEVAIEADCARPVIETSRSSPAGKKSSLNTVSESAEGLALRIISHPAAQQRKRRVQSWKQFLVFTAGACTIVTGILATQWLMRWNTRRAGAASENPTEPAVKPPGPVR